jgi:hypothetical protein
MTPYAQIGTLQIFELWYGKADYRMRELFLGHGLNGTEYEVPSTSSLMERKRRWSK